MEIKQISRCKDYPGGFVLEFGEQRRRVRAVEPAAALIHDLASVRKRGRRTADYGSSDAGWRKRQRLYSHCEGSAKLRRLRPDSSWAVQVCSRCLPLCLIAAFSEDKCLTSYVEFRVQKEREPKERARDSVRRILCLSETCLIERDPASYAAICARPLKTVTSHLSSKLSRSCRLSVSIGISRTRRSSPSSTKTATKERTLQLTGSHSSCQSAPQSLLFQGLDPRFPHRWHSRVGELPGVCHLAQVRAVLAVAAIQTAARRRRRGPTNEADQYHST